MEQRLPPTKQNQLIGWLADYFRLPSAVFHKMTPDKRWDIYQRICGKSLYPGAEVDNARALYH